MWERLAYDYSGRIFILGLGVDWSGVEWSEVEGSRIRWCLSSRSG